MADSEEIKKTSARNVAIAAADDFGWGKIIKASEIFRLRPVAKKDVGLAASKLFNLMLGVAAVGRFEDKLYSIAKRDIRRSHKGNERIDDIVLELQTTIYTAPVLSPRGKKAVFRAALVSSTITEDDISDDSLIYFRLPPDLLRIYDRDTQYSELHGPTLVKFDSQYALRLYEIGRMMAKREHPRMRVTPEELRDMLRVPESSYRNNWDGLYKKALLVAVNEVNHTAEDFLVQVPENEIRRSGRKVMSLLIQFMKKSPAQQEAARKEAAASEVGRRVRRNGTAEVVVDELERLTADDLPFMSDIPLSKENVRDAEPPPKFKKPKQPPAKAAPKGPQPKTSPRLPKVAEPAGPLVMDLLASQYLETLDDDSLSDWHAIAIDNGAPAETPMLPTMPWARWVVDELDKVGRLGR